MKTLSRRTFLSKAAAAAAVMATGTLTLPSFPVAAQPMPDDDTIVDMFASESFDVIATCLDRINRPELTMAYFDWLGIQFYWYERDPGASDRVVNQTGLMWSAPYGDTDWLDQCWGARQRAFLDAWEPRIREYARTSLGPFEPGCTRIGYWVV